MAKRKARVIRSLEETAAYFGVSVPAVKKWIVRGCPVAKKGGQGVRYQMDIEAVQRWRRKRDEAKEADALKRAEAEARLRLEALGEDMLPDLTVDGQPMTPRQLEAALKAEVNKVRLAQLRGELVSFEDVAMEVASAMAQLSARLLALPDHMAAQMALTEEQVETMRGLIEETLHDAADAIRDLEPNGDSAAA